MTRDYHKFNPDHKSKLELPKRQLYLPAKDLLLEMGLTTGMKIADVGCGTGYFSFPAASIVGASGEVLALDISEEMILSVHEKAIHLGIKNLITIQTDEYNLKLKDETMDRTLLCTILHEVDETYRMLWECRRILVPGGKCVVIDWIKQEDDWGPPTSHRLASEYVEQKMRSAGFTDVGVIILNPHFYYIIGTKT